MLKRVTLVLVAVIFAISMISPALAADMTPEQLVKEAKASIAEVSIDNVKKMIESKENIMLLDVTDKQEFEQGHLPGAINISRGTLEFKAATIIPDKNAKIIVYCGTDRRSPLATKTLNDLGYKSAVNMTGGLKAWKEAGYPVVK
ncbi:MAG: rhodanese-like domain-containing protein [Dissulfurispiraceae bacterium]